MYGYFMEPQNYSVNDGDGIRTIIFFAGCPLNCRWCSNPECKEDFNRISFFGDTCIGCGRCSEICPSGIGIDLNENSSREMCTSCGSCAGCCPTNSRRKLIRKYSESEILEVVERQEIFFRYSNGGVTFSGGEATMQQPMLRHLVNKLYDKAVNMALETSGYFELNEVEDIFEKLDLIFADIKHMDNEKHVYYTGKSNEQILSNIRELGRRNVPLVIRIPVINGVNADLKNISATARFVRENVRNPKIEILPYHNFGDEKYRCLGLAKPSEEYKRPSEEELRIIKKTIENEGVETVSYI